MHVRSDESQLREATADGYARSATFRALVDAVEALPCIVYLGSTVKLSRGRSGSLLHSSVGRQERPILRVLITTNLSRPERIATIGHELQHVIEACPTVTDSRTTITELFEALDPATKTTDGRMYETEAAMSVSARIRDELRRPAGPPQP